jgi:tRNA guanosine-2'-O-methyltransferase
VDRGTTDTTGKTGIHLSSASNTLTLTPDSPKQIFAAATLVLPDLRVTKEPLFESISSSAARWVRMEQVKDMETREYLRRMKRQGYTIVGLEQTSTSQCLTRVELPRRMVLLLGREKEGVPVELLAEVDRLVEIPQLGIVRSLNVHVSASLILWEYTRQHRFGGPVAGGCATD